jgi:phenylalanine-4-hydroxylase
MEQNYFSYTKEDFLVWKTLFERQMKNLNEKGSKRYLEAVDEIGFNADSIPDFTAVNKRLHKATGWQIEVVAGIVSPQLFFELLASKRFPSSTWLRKMTQLDYLEEPDMFHDTFGHVPLLMNKEYTEFFSGIAALALPYANDPRAMELFTRLYWFTIEFGLIREENVLKVYGAGLISSSGETDFSLSNGPKHIEYSVKEIFDSPFRNDVYQEKYFIIDSFAQLFDSLDEAAELTKVFLLNPALALAPSV